MCLFSRYKHSAIFLSMTAYKRVKNKRTFYFYLFNWCYFGWYCEIYSPFFLWLYYIIWWKAMHLQAPIITNYGNVNCNHNTNHSNVWTFYFVFQIITINQKDKNELHLSLKKNKTQICDNITWFVLFIFFIVASVSNYVIKIQIY